MKMISRRPSLSAAIALARAAVAGPCASGTMALAWTPRHPPHRQIPVAHSALLTIYGVPTDDGLALHVKHAGNQIPIDGRDVTVSVDGKNQPVTAAPEGTFVLPTKDLAGDGERQLDIVVAHDGIREILTGKVTLPKVERDPRPMARPQADGLVGPQRRHRSDRGHGVLAPAIEACREERRVSRPCVTHHPGRNPMRKAPQCRPRTKMGADRSLISMKFPPPMLRRYVCSRKRLVLWATFFTARSL